MIANPSKTILVDGVDSAGAAYKRSESEVAEGAFYIANGNKDPLGTAAIAVTDTIVAYVNKSILLHNTAVYIISGVATPGDTIVYLSGCSATDSVDELKNNVIATTYANKNGIFNFPKISYPSGTVTMWMATWAQDAPTASLTYARSVVGDINYTGTLLTNAFTVPVNEEYTTPLFTIKGTCPKGVETVYVSCVDKVESIGNLMETLSASATPLNESFTIKCSGEYEQQYIVWCLSENNGRLVVSSIEVSNNASACLSGDTMIAMDDGTSKRMDALHIGDIVLSDGGTRSRIHTIRKGQFSDYHTLYHFEDGTVIDETHPHRFYNVDQGFWQRLQLWNIGDHAINKDGDKIALVSVERIEEKAEMFGIWTDSGTYYANGLLSGAAFCNKELLAEADAEKAIDMMLSADEEILVKLMGLDGVLP